jgi:hypothetical protein
MKKDIQNSLTSILRSMSSLFANTSDSDDSSSDVVLINSSKQFFQNYQGSSRDTDWSSTRGYD